MVPRAKLVIHELGKGKRRRNPAASLGSGSVIHNMQSGWLLGASLGVNIGANIIKCPY